MFTILAPNKMDMSTRTFIGFILLDEVYMLVDWNSLKYYSNYDYLYQ